MHLPIALSRQRFWDVDLVECEFHYIVIVFKIFPINCGSSNICFLLVFHHKCNIW